MCYGVLRLSRPVIGIPLMKLVNLLFSFFEDNWLQNNFFPHIKPNLPYISSLDVLVLIYFRLLVVNSNPVYPISTKFRIVIKKTSNTVNLISTLMWAISITAIERKKYVVSRLASSSISFNIMLRWFWIISLIIVRHHLKLANDVIEIIK